MSDKVIATIVAATTAAINKFINNIDKITIRED